jgi:hypothetical protein
MTHLIFKELGTSVSGKTIFFNVFGYKMALLGTISWYSSWRQYVFEPYIGNVWSHDCLLELSQFIKSLMDKRKRVIT